MNRRKFIHKGTVGMMASLLPDFACKTKRSGNYDPVMTVTGEMSAENMGFTLTHEHILVDFSGADKYDPSKWDDASVIEVVTPYLEEIVKLGCNSFIDCTPEYIGRDPYVLRRLSQGTGLNILTNTGIYGASDNKYVPDYAYRESADDLSRRWVREFEEGIGDTGIKPGFMKIGVAPGSLSEMHKKLVTAAAKTHLLTGLTIASHTGPAIPAFEELRILQDNGIHPEAFVWVHAQNEKNTELHIRAAEMGAWVSLDGLNEENVDQYLDYLKNFRNNRLLHKVLISHDAGWYSPGEENGGEFRPYTAVFKRLIPALASNGFDQEKINTIFMDNPGKAFSVRVREN